MYQMAVMYSKWQKMYQMAVMYSKWQKMYQMAAIYSKLPNNITKIFHSKALDNLPQLLFLQIWQHWRRGCF
jgi:hypothetical protein